MSHLSAAITISQQLADARSKVTEGKTAARRSKELRAALAPEVWDAYHVEGLSELQIAAHLVGVSHDTVHRIVGSRRHPRARPAG